MTITELLTRIGDEGYQYSADSAIVKIGDDVVAHFESLSMYCWIAEEYKEEFGELMEEWKLGLVE